MQVVGEVVGRFRPPVGTVLPVVAALTLIALVFWLAGWGFAGWVFPVGTSRASCCSDHDKG